MANERSIASQPERSRRVTRVAQWWRKKVLPQLKRAGYELSYPFRKSKRKFIFIETDDFARGDLAGKPQGEVGKVIQVKRRKVLVEFGNNNKKSRWMSKANLCRVKILDY